MPKLTALFIDPDIYTLLHDYRDIAMIRGISYEIKNVVLNKCKWNRQSDNLTIIEHA